MTFLFGEATAGHENSSVRETWLEQTLASIPAGQRILDAGAGERQFKRFCSHLDYVAQDFGQYDGHGDGAGLQTGKWDQSGLDIVSDITDMPVENSSFDAVMCTEVFEHLPAPIEAVREFARVLRPGGILVLTAPFCSITHFAPYHFYSGFNRYFYETNLPRMGFEILDIQSNGNAFEFNAQELRRLPSLVREYSGVRWSRSQALAYRVGARLLLELMTRASRTDRGSAGLLNFGFHVKARKLSA
jgi:ubiquinone/menaquinone biosynthesis C-methylase UbiE